MYLCYIDESGTSSIPGNTSHFILAGLSVPIWHWKSSDRDIAAIKRKYSLDDAELHTAWILRKYLEQEKISGFSNLSHAQRRSEVGKIRRAELLNLQKTNKNKQYKQTKKNFKKTDDYIHLTYRERCTFINEVANCVSKWGYARLFAECIDKVHFDPTKRVESLDVQAFEQLVSRFEQYLENIGNNEKKCFGLLIHDNNETVASKHTQLMKSFHKSGTLWTDLNNIIETPLFVDSELTSMIQIADLCSYAIRRYLENQENELFNMIFTRADRKNGVVVGMRHFTDNSCHCEICKSHKRN